CAESGDEFGCQGDEQDGGAATSNSQGNGNEANAWVTQGNMADQSQTTTQTQTVTGATGNGCDSGCDNGCDSGCQPNPCDKCGDDGVSQSSEGGDQSATQENHAKVIQSPRHHNYK